ncbi:MAG: cupin domain-containing protein [Armatimonadota bacterium]
MKLVDLHLGDEADRQAVYETDDIQIMRVRLHGGEALPTHNANSNVLLVPLHGVVTVKTEEGEVTAEAGEAIPVAYGTKMDVSNNSMAASAFLVLKTPHPKKMKG